MNILLGVTGGIAAYKMPSLVSALKTREHEVRVIMTSAGSKFITETALRTMSGHSVMTSMWDQETRVIHIDLANWAEVFVVCPATANTIGKMAHGIADDALSTVHLALPSSVVKVVCPAMNVNMFNNPIVRDNMKRLFELGYHLLPPEEGMLACGDEGKGKLPGTMAIVEFIERSVS